MTYGLGYLLKIKFCSVQQLFSDLGNTKTSSTKQFMYSKQTFKESVDMGKLDAFFCLFCTLVADFDPHFLFLAGFSPLATLASASSTFSPSPSVALHISLDFPPIILILPWTRMSIEGKLIDPSFCFMTYRHVKNWFTLLLDRSQTTSCLDSKLFLYIFIFINQKFQFMIFTIAMTILLSDIQVWPWPSTYLNKCFK